MDYSLEIRFLIKDMDSPPDLMTKALGVTPDETSIKGHFKRPGIRVKRNIWWLYSQIPFDDSSVELQWAGISKRLHSAKSALKNLPVDAKKVALVIVEAYKYFPDVDIPVEVMQELVDLGIEIEIAYHDLIEEEDQSDTR